MIVPGGVWQVRGIAAGGLAGTSAPLDESGMAVHRSGELRRQSADLQEVVGRGVPQRDGLHLVPAAHEKSLQAAVAHVGMGALAAEVVEARTCDLPVLGFPRRCCATAP
jgi:hypothetical protein